MRSRSLLASTIFVAGTLLSPGTSAAPPYKGTDKELVNELTDEWADDEYNSNDMLPLDDNPDRLGLTEDREVEENIFIDAPAKTSVPMDQRVGLLDDDEFQVGLLDDDGFQVGLLDDDDFQVDLLDDDDDIRVGLLDDDEEDMRVGLLEDDDDYDEEGPEEDNESIDVSSDDDNFDDTSLDDDDEEEVSIQPLKSKEDRYHTLNLDATDPEELEVIAVVADEENTDDSDLTEETPWDDQQKEGETDEDDNDAVPNLFGDTKEPHETHDPQPKPKMVDKTGAKNTDDGLIIEDQIKKESEKMLDAGKVDEVPNTAPVRPAAEDPDTENDLITLDDYQVDSTVDDINDSLEKALNSIQHSNPPPLIPGDGIPLFSPERAGSRFFPDENDRRYVDPKPYTKPTNAADGPSVGLIFLATILLFLLYKSPRIKRYIVSRTSDYNKSLPYHAGKMRD